ncbi:hypothetical protein, partial [uncultured Nostoc sp.]|uniref:hypothetical protein n=1 Tax=uncultured Nostoc sp. TaxID=340711 RepID=UPI0035CB3A26
PYLLFFTQFGFIAPTYLNKFGRTTRVLPSLYLVECDRLRRGVAHRYFLVSSCSMLRSVFVQAF